MAADNDWSKPKALAIPKEGYFTLQQGRYGPTYPRTPACHGFTLIARIKPGTEADIRATDWKTNATAFIQFVREHQCPSFLEYGEYPYVSAAEIKKALALKQAFSSMLDQMQ
jgi:hypothetical protein